MEVGGWLHAPVSLFPGKSSQYIINRRLGGHRAGLDPLEKER
jgi:hypothetical protein